VCFVIAFRPDLEIKNKKLLLKKQNHGSYESYLTSLLLFVRFVIPYYFLASPLLRFSQNFLHLKEDHLEVIRNKYFYHYDLNYLKIHLYFIIWLCYIIRPVI